MLVYHRVNWGFFLRKKDQKASGGATHGAHGQAGSAHRASHQTGEMRQCPELQIGEGPRGMERWRIMVAYHVMVKINGSNKKQLTIVIITNELNEHHVFICAHYSPCNLFPTIFQYACLKTACSVPGGSKMFQVMAFELPNQRLRWYLVDLKP
jgi:hypothetical protein